jgi:hypothetical protein
MGKNQDPDPRSATLEKNHGCVNPRKKVLKSKKVILYLIKLSVIKKESRSRRKNVRVEAGAGAVIRIYGSAEPESKEIFTAPHHWFRAVRFV